MYKPHHNANPDVEKSDISKQSPRPLHHTFLLGRARFTAQPLSALDPGDDQLYEYDDDSSDNDSDDFAVEEDGAIRDMPNSELGFLFARGTQREYRGTQREIL